MTALLESVIPDMLDSQHPLAVLNTEGEVEGHISRSTLADILSDQPTDEAETQSDKNSVQQ